MKYKYSTGDHFFKKKHTGKIRISRMMELQVFHVNTVCFIRKNRSGCLATCVCVGGRDGGRWTKNETRLTHARPNHGDCWVRSQLFEKKLWTPWFHYGHDVDWSANRVTMNSRVMNSVMRVRCEVETLSKQISGILRTTRCHEHRKIRSSGHHQTSLTTGEWGPELE
jgi:hypothetical protein